MTNNTPATVKIKTKKGMILTLTIIKTTNDSYLGDDKFGKPVIIPFADIESMLPVRT